MKMDRALKERIIGAVVLVLFVVLVVPVFLDGPPEPSEIISERVPLPGQEDQEIRTVVLDRDRTEPVPVASAERPAASEPEPARSAVAAGAESAPEPEPQPARSAPAAEQDTTPPPAQAPAASATGMWAVQLGSFGNEANAERLAADLRKQGFAAFLSRLQSDSGTLHRVRVGPQKDRESAEEMAARLAKAGHKGQVVPHP